MNFMKNRCKVKILSKRIGYSIMEFLMVMAIIAILATISIPHLSKYFRFYKYENYASQLELLVRQAKMLAMTKSINVGVCVEDDRTVKLIDKGTERGGGVCNGEQIKVLEIKPTESSYINFAGSGFSLDPRGFAILNGNVCIENTDTNNYFLICVSRFGGIRTQKGTGGCRSCSE